MGKHFSWWNEGIYTEGKGSMFGYTRAVCYYDTPDAREGWLEEVDDDYDILKPTDQFQRMCDILVALYDEYGWPDFEIRDYEDGHYLPDVLNDPEPWRK